MAESKRAAASARAGGAEEKAKALETALAQIKKQFGEGAVMRLGQDSALNVEAIPTGSLSLDLALGIGGVPRGRIIEIYGPESSGKTTLALHCIAEGQKRGGNAAFIDVEHALDPVYAGNLGVDVDSLLVSQPDTGELLDIAVKLEIVQKAGAWFSYNGERIGQGRDNSKEFLATHPEIADEIEAKVRENVDKLYDKIPGRPAPREVAKPVELPPAEAPAQQTLTPPPANKAAAKKSIDITVDDD